jgi:hypothetical protein
MATKKHSPAKPKPKPGLLPSGFTKTAPQEIRPEDVKNSDTPPIYCNNFQIRGGPVDVWLCFNTVNPTGPLSPSGDFVAERKATVVVSLAQFFAITDMMAKQATALQAQVGQMAEEVRKSSGQSSTQDS